MRLVAWLAIPILCWGEAAYGGAGVGEICDVQRHIAGRLVWSENLRTLIGANVDGEVERVAVQGDYVLAAGSRDGRPALFIIDVRDRDGRVETFAELAAWEHRLKNLGLTYPAWRNVRDFPRMLEPDVECALAAVAFLGIFLPLAYPVATSTSIALLFGAACLWRRRRKAIAANR